MKALISFIISFLAVSLVHAQGINFQGVARSANGTIIAGSNISLRLSILSKSVDATPEYIETKTVMTNTQGIFSVVVGDAAANASVGNFKNIAWVDGVKFLKVEMDPVGGTNFINMGTTQLQYVPYSFYSLGVAAANVNGVLPVEKGGTGVRTIEELKSALDIKADTISLSKRINDKLDKIDTVSLSNRINNLSTKINNQGNLFSATSVSQFERDKLNNLNPGSIIWCKNCSSNGELQVYNGKGWSNLTGGAISKATPELDSTIVFNITGHTALAKSIVLFNDDGAQSQNLTVGFTWSTATNPKIENGLRTAEYFNNLTRKDSLAINGSLINLTKNTKYYIRSYATNQIGTSYGTEKIFYTTSVTSAPVSPTFAESYITPSKAAFTINIEDAGGEPIIESGIEYATNRNFSPLTRVSVKNEKNEYLINSLVPIQKYYIRGFVKTALGDVAQNDTSSFIAMDINAELNKTSVQIGPKIWTARNLNVVTYRNGEPIPLVTDSATWSNLTTGAYTYYKNDSVNYGFLGKIYNWYAVTDVRGLAPVGWHIPTLTEVDNMISYLGGGNVAGPKLINISGNINYDWMPNYPSNLTGFSSLYSGGRQMFSTEAPDFLCNNCNTSFYWSKDDYNYSNAASHNYRGYFTVSNGFTISAYDQNSPSYNFAKSGMYIRLVKD